MAVRVTIISATRFKVNGKVLSLQKRGWHSKPYLSNPHETNVARSVIAQLKSGAIDPATAPEQILF